MYEIDYKRLRQSRKPTLAQQQGWKPAVMTTVIPDVDPASADAEKERRKLIDKLYKNNLI
jgi:hypothetical protein